MSVVDELRTAITKALPGAEVEVAGGGGGHFSLRVVSGAFAGLGTLERHRLVLGAIKHLMAGDGAPVHAVDSLETRTP
ncbi:MAG: BolA/IbaG family iron-sulfur metabolism protein [Polyangiaceae bacterium]|nr:BolA/IbaG family iron-sulfur metabolism protein [Polyangiaceae bacterium]